MTAKEAIVIIVDRGKADSIVKEAKKAGARGATVFYGRGTGQHEAKKFWNINVESSKEAILILCKTSETKNIVSTVVEAGNLKEPGKGIVFTMPVNGIIGFTD
jgi:nitrogen regulatory protein PII